MDTQPKRGNVRIYEILINLRDEFYSVVSVPRNLKIDIDSNLENIDIFADKDHCKLIFRNIFWNSLRATEKRALKHYTMGGGWISEHISITPKYSDGIKHSIIIMDNGCGLEPKIRNKLYKEVK